MSTSCTLVMDNFGVVPGLKAIKEGPLIIVAKDPRWFLTSIYNISQSHCLDLHVCEVCLETFDTDSKITE